MHALTATYFRANFFLFHFSLRHFIFMNVVALTDSPRMQMNMHNSYWRYSRTHISHIIYPSLRFFSFWSTFWTIATAIATSFQYHTLTLTSFHCHMWNLTMYATTDIYFVQLSLSPKLCWLAWSSTALTRYTFAQYVWKLHLVFMKLYRIFSISLQLCGRYFRCATPSTTSPTVYLLSRHNAYTHIIHIQLNRNLCPTLSLSLYCWTALLLSPSLSLVMLL